MINKGGYFTKVDQSAFDEAKKSTRYDRYKAQAAEKAKLKKSEKDV